MYGDMGIIFLQIQALLTYVYKRVIIIFDISQK